MPAYNFQGRFVEAILDGSKRQTIRRRRRRRETRSGDVLRLYTGMRTKECRLLRTVDCTSVVPIQIIGSKIIRLDGRILNDVERGLFIKRDGFRDADDFWDFFNRYSLDVLLKELELIYWR